MKLVNGYILQCLRRIILPENSILRAYKQIVKHFIVGHENVWRTIEHSIVICDNAMLAHHTAWSFLSASYIHTDIDIAPQLRAVIDDLSDTLCLIGRKCVHRIYDKSLDATLSTVLIAVFKDRIQETLRLT